MGRVSMRRPRDPHQPLRRRGNDRHAAPLRQRRERRRIRLAQPPIELRGGARSAARARDLHAPGARQVRLIDVPGAHVLLGAPHPREKSLGLLLGHRAAVETVGRIGAPPAAARASATMSAQNIGSALLPYREHAAAARAHGRAHRVYAAQTPPRAAAYVAAPAAARSPARARSRDTAPSPLRTATAPPHPRGAAPRPPGATSARARRESVSPSIVVPSAPSRPSAVSHSAARGAASSRVVVASGPDAALSSSSG